MKKKFVWTALFCGFLIWVLAGFTGCKQDADTAEVDPGEPLPSLEGTLWRWNSGWGDQRFSFTAEDTVIYSLDYPEDSSLNETVPYHYTYDGNTKRGTIDERGDFSIAKDNKTLHFPSYYVYGHSAEFTKIYRLFRFPGGYGMVRRNWRNRGLGNLCVP